MVLGLWPHCLCCHMAPRCVSVHPNVLCGDTSHWIRVQPACRRPHPNSIISAKTRFPNKFTFTGASGHDLFMGGGGHRPTPYSLPVTVCRSLPLPSYSHTHVCRALGMMSGSQLSINSSPPGACLSPQGSRCHCSGATAAMHLLPRAGSGLSLGDMFP